MAAPLKALAVVSPAAPTDPAAEPPRTRRDSKEKPVETVASPCVGLLVVGGLVVLSVTATYAFAHLAIDPVDISVP
tara:strand:+ start:125 stop:352 length:228 start_codon:yes stop_codon:yes gene_type:complete